MIFTQPSQQIILKIKNAYLEGVNAALRELETSVATLRFLSRKTIWHDAAHNTIANAESL